MHASSDSQASLRPVHCCQTGTQMQHFSFTVARPAFEVWLLANVYSQQRETRIYTADSQLKLPFVAGEPAVHVVAILFSKVH